MYLWSLFGYDLMERPILHGVTDDLAKAMRAAEPQLRDGRAFICVIEEVRLRINVTGLEESYVATGKRWSGRRTTTDRVHWRLSVTAADASLVYRVPASPCGGDKHGLPGLVA